MSERRYLVVRAPRRLAGLTRYLKIFDPSGEFTWPADIGAADEFNLVDAAILVRLASTEDEMEYHLERSQ